jgi:Undecaprenyl-phosphate galactose phosphotransferase WbaP
MAFAYEKRAVSPADGGFLPEPGHRARPSSRRGALGPPGRLIMPASLVLADALAILSALCLGSELYRILVGGFGVLALDPRLLVAVAALPAGYWLLDIYHVHGQAPIERFPLRIKATCMLFALLVAWHYSTAGAHWPVAAVGLAFLFALALPLVAEALVRGALIRFKLWGTPAVVIGAGPTGRRVVRILKQMPELGLRPVAFFDDGGACSAAALVEGIPVLGTVRESAEYSHRIDTAILTMPAEAPERVGAVASELGFRDIIVVPDLRDLPSLWLRTRDLNGLIGLQMRRNLLLRRNRLIKQTVDYMIALPVFVLSAPVIAGLALWIMAVSRGSPFYVQIRAGKDGRPIRVWKLRTMHLDAEQRLEQCLSEDPAARQEWERCCKLTDDPRILPGVGHVLRRTSLDELPQIFNVIRGEMSLVGPRPFPKYHLDRFDIGFQSLRSSVIPGITGLWQVSARSDGDLEVQQALDTYYIRNWSIWIDLYILSRTLGAVLAGRGAR